MSALCCSSTLLLALLALLAVSNAQAGDLDLLEGGVQKWSSPSNVARCPVHSEIQPVAADGGEGVSFVVESKSGKRFSLLENYMPAGGLAGYGGLQLNFTSSGLASWKLRLYDGQTNVRFVYIINKPDGAHSLTLPWSVFRAEKSKRCNTIIDGYKLQPSSISHLAVYFPNGKTQAQLTLQGMHAMRDMSATALAATATAMDDMVEGFDGPFIGMGISGHNDFAAMSVNNPAECGEACTQTAGCRSFDYGARGSVAGECWLSLADRDSAGSAYESWGLYNYYEVKSASTDVASADAATTKSTGIPITDMTLSVADMAAFMALFNGPYVGMGITGHNDFELVTVNDPAECAEACTKTLDCNSFDYGARRTVVGECWLSRADRKSVGAAYRTWELYDYYEIKTAGSTDTGATFIEGRIEGASKDEMPAVNQDSSSPSTNINQDTSSSSTVPGPAVSQGISSTSTFPLSDSSHAYRHSPKPMACVQAVGALLIFMAV